MTLSVAERKELGPGMIARVLEMQDDFGLSDEEIIAIVCVPSKQIWLAWVGCWVHNRPFVIDEGSLYRMSLVLDIHREMKSFVSQDILKRWVRERGWNPLLRVKPLDVFLGPVSQIEAYRAHLLSWMSLSVFKTHKVVCISD